MISKRYIYFFVSVFILLSIIRWSMDHSISLWEDHDIAVNLLQDGEFYYESDGARNHSFQFPVYAFSVSVFYSFFGIQPILICFLNIFIHVFSGIIFYYLFRLILDLLKISLPENQKEKIVLVSLLIFLFHPVLLIYSFFHVHPLSFNILSIFSGLYFSLRMAVQSNFRNLLIGGVVVGIAMLDRATVVLTLIPAGILLWKSEGFLSAFKKMCLPVFMALLVVTPWLIRNYQMDGIIGFESSAAKNIWKGVLYNSDGSNYLLDGENYYSALSDAEKKYLGEMSPIEQRDFFNDKYAEIWKKDPGHVIKMFFMKWKNFWWFRNGAGTEWGAWKKFLPWYKMIYGISCLLILYFLYRHFKMGIVLFSFPLALSLLQAFFYVETRHRIAIEPFLYFLAVIATFELYHQWLNRPKKITHG